MIKHEDIGPLIYKITFLAEHFDRKPVVVVLARDIPEAIETARAYANSEAMSPGKVINVEALIARWVDTSPQPPDVISKSALAYFQDTLAQMDKAQT